MGSASVLYQNARECRALHDPLLLETYLSVHKCYVFGSLYLVHSGFGDSARIQCLQRVR